jgi:two-component system CheB/CheR fusion protein
MRESKGGQTDGEIRAKDRPCGDDGGERLLHALQSHQVDLEAKVAELERAKEELQAGLRRYSELCDFAPIGFLSLSPEGIILKTNLTAVRLLGVDREHMVGMSLGSVMTDASRAPFAAFLQRTFTGARKETCELVLDQKVARVATLHAEGCAAEDRRECLVMLMDTSERTAAEEVVKAREERASQIAEALRERIKELRCLYSVADVLVQNDDADQVLRAIVELLPPGWFHPDLACARITLPAGEFRTSNFQDTPWAMSASIVAQGQPVGAVEVRYLQQTPPRGEGPFLKEERDLINAIAQRLGAFVERKQTEQALKESEKRAQVAAEALRNVDRRKSQFLATLSHELRNPLSPIINSLYILGRAPPGSEKANKARAVIERQFAQIVRLVEDMLDVTRIARNKVRLCRESLDLNELVRRTVEDYRVQFDKAGIALEMSAPPDPVLVSVDGNRLTQIVGNLLQNALKFTRRGGTTRVSVSVAEAEARALVRVADNGAGIAPDMLARIFEPFLQVDQTLDQARGGLGLGLALVKSLVELHGGEVCARSAGLGQGAEFEVALPLATQAPGRANAGPVTHRRVLVIAGDVESAEALRDMLEIGEHHVAVIDDGKQALPLAREFRPDVVLCDINLRGMSGYDVARTLRADETLGRILLVALGGRGLPEDVQRARLAGFHCHLTKPLSVARFEDLLCSAE